MAIRYLFAYVLFNDGIQTVLAIAGAFAADTLGIPLAFNMATIVIIQLVAVPGATGFGWLADKITTKRALGTALIGWIIVILFGIGIAPLGPQEHEDFDFQLDYRDGSSVYVVAAAPHLDGGGRVLKSEGDSWELKEGAMFRSETGPALRDAVAGEHGIGYTLSFRGGPMDGESAVGPEHPSVLGRGVLDWWPGLVRDTVWRPLGLDAGYQWLLLGVSVGVVIGGSQALARSLFAQITPQSPERGVLFLLRVHEPGVVGVRADDLRYCDGGVRHTGGGYGHPVDHRRGYDPPEVGERGGRGTGRRDGEPAGPRRPSLTGAETRGGLGRPVSPGRTSPGWTACRPS